MYIVIKVKNKRGKIRMDKNVEILHTHTHTGTLAKNIKKYFNIYQRQEYL